MAETSGFFQAMIDENTGDYDRKYLAKQFADYFALFVKNGVFGSPTNQLIVSPGSGLSISVSHGNAFIKGMWYNNSSVKSIAIIPNYTSSNRIDTVRVRMSDLLRNITVDVYTGDSDLVRTEDVYDLQLAKITVRPGASSITAADVEDTRPNQEVCGFVTQLLRAETTADLFAQYQEQFDQWFANVRDQLSEDAAGNLQNQIDDMDASLKSLISGQNQLLTMDITGQIVWADSGINGYRGPIPPSILGNEVPLFILGDSIFYSDEKDNINYSMFGIEFLYVTYSARDYVDYNSGTEDLYSRVEVDDKIPVEPRTTGILRGYTPNAGHSSRFSLEASVGYTEVTTTGGGTETKIVGGVYTRHVKTTVYTTGYGYVMDKFPKHFSKDGAIGLGTRACLPYAAVLYGITKKIQPTEVTRLWKGGKKVNEHVYNLDDMWKGVY